jgi:hypothetical protein
MDDDEVVVHPARPALKAVVFQPNIGICLAVVFDDVIWCLETFWEMLITHVAPECLGPWPIKAEAVPLLIITPTTAWVVCCARTVRPCPPVSLTMRRGSGRLFGWPDRTWEALWQPSTGWP